VAWHAGATGVTLIITGPTHTMPQHDFNDNAQEE
jgi:hypothetical protein